MTITPPPFDDRPFVRLEHGMPENPKVVGLSDAAFRLYIEVICWCSRQESDGLVPEAMMKRLGRPKPIRELTDSGLLDVILGGAFQVHDYLVHQRSREEIAAFRASRSDSGKKGNHTRWHLARRRFDPECEFCNEVAPAIAGGSHQRSQNRPNRIADTDTDADAAISSISPRSSGGDSKSSSSPSVSGKAANG